MEPGPFRAILVASKGQIRSEIKKTLKNTKSGAFSAQGEAAAARLRDSPIWPEVEAIFLFLSMKSEIDTQALIKMALEDRKKVFAPKVECEKLIFLPILTANGPWQTGQFGIREPMEEPREKGRPDSAASDNIPAIRNRETLLIIAPGLAFDREGNRLGRGKGYYDRFFAEMDTDGRKYAAIGLCMDFQLFEKVPAGRHDKKMHGILTGREMILVSSADDIRKTALP